MLLIELAPELRTRALAPEARRDFELVRAVAKLVPNTKLGVAGGVGNISLALDALGIVLKG